MVKRSRKLPPEKRQKVSTACDGCKKRKFKCTGTQPCKLCSKKGIECTYSIVDKRSLKGQQQAVKLSADSEPIIKPYRESSEVKTFKPEPKEPIKEPRIQSPIVTTASPTKSIANSMDSRVQDPLVNHPSLFVVDDVLKYTGKSDYNSLIKDFNALSPSLNTKEFNPQHIRNDFQLQPNMTILPLPTKYDMTMKFKTFNENYCYWNIFSPGECETVITSVYELNEHITKYFVIIYLVTGIVDSNESYFRNGLVLLHREVDVELDNWQSKIQFLISFNYRQFKILNKSYYHLGNAINIAKLLGLDYSYLAINDSYLSCLMGVPTQLNLNTVEKSDDPLYNLITILNQILLNFYNKTSNSLSMSIYRLKELSIELKSWSINLATNLKLSETCSVHLHVINLTSILLLSRPFHLYHILTILNPKVYSLSQYSSISKDYFISAVNSSVYSIYLIDKFQQFDDLAVNLLHQSCQMIYYSIQFMEKFNLHYNFNLNYLKYILSLSAKSVTDPKYTQFTPAETFREINMQDIKNFQDYFVSNEIAPTFKKSIDYGVYDKLLLNKLH